MNIVYVTGLFANKNTDVLGGMQYYTYKMATYMQSKGHSVTILTAGNEKKRWKYKGIPVYCVKLPKVCNASNKLVKYIVLPVMRDTAFNRALHNLDKECKISLVQYAGWYGVGMLYHGRFPSVLRISTYVKAQLSLLHTKTELAVISWEEKMAARNFNGIIAPSRALGNIYGAQTNRKINIIETPYYSASDKMLHEDMVFYKNKLSDKKYFLFFGRISPDKGIDTIIRALKKILSRYPELYFCFAGEFFLHQKEKILKNMEECAGECFERVIYLGNLTHEKLFPVIRNAECVVMPSLMDNLPNACLEAMELNGIVIGTRGASFDEIFEDKVSGLLININDSKALVEKIDYVMHMTNNEKMNMKQNAKKCLDKYKPENAGAKMERYYNKLISVCR